MKNEIRIYNDGTLVETKLSIKTSSSTPLHGYSLKEILQLVCSTNVSQQILGLSVLSRIIFYARNNQYGSLSENILEYYYYCGNKDLIESNYQRKIDEIQSNTPEYTMILFQICKYLQSKNISLSSSSLFTLRNMVCPIYLNINDSAFLFDTLKGNMGVTFNDKHLDGILSTLLSYNIFLLLNNFLIHSISNEQLNEDKENSIMSNQKAVHEILTAFANNNHSVAIWSSPIFQTVTNSLNKSSIRLIRVIVQNSEQISVKIMQSDIISKLFLMKNACSDTQFIEILRLIRTFHCNNQELATQVFSSIISHLYTSLFQYLDKFVNYSTNSRDNIILRCLYNILIYYNSKIINDVYEKTCQYLFNFLSSNFISQKNTQNNNILVVTGMIQFMTTHYNKYVTTRLGSDIYINLFYSWRKNHFLYRLLITLGMKITEERHAIYQLDFMIYYVNLLNSILKNNKEIYNSLLSSDLFVYIFKIISILNIQVEEKTLWFNHYKRLLTLYSIEIISLYDHFYPIYCSLTPRIKSKFPNKLLLFSFSYLSISRISSSVKINEYMALFHIISSYDILIILHSKLLNTLGKDLNFDIYTLTTQLNELWKSLSNYSFVFSDSWIYTICNLFKYSSRLNVTAVLYLITVIEILPEFIHLRSNSLFYAIFDIYELGSNVFLDPDIASLLNILYTHSQFFKSKSDVLITSSFIQQYYRIVNMFLAESYGDNTFFDILYYFCVGDWPSEMRNYLIDNIPKEYVQFEKKLKQISKTRQMVKKDSIIQFDKLNKKI